MDNTKKEQKDETFGWVKRFLVNPTSELIVLTLLFGSVTFYVFWLTIYWQLLPTELVSPFLSQEDTGLFDALGGWALGFAGALVAIRIAGVAAQIQENDSIREQVKLMEAQVSQVSELNSELNRAISDAKRACSAVILFAKDLHHQESQAYMNNSPEGLRRLACNHKPHDERKEELQATLQKKLEHLVQTIEKSFQNSTFRDVLNFTCDESRCADRANKKGILSPLFSTKPSPNDGQSPKVIEKEKFIDSFFERVSMDASPFSGKSDDIRQQLIDIVKKDNVYFKVLDIVNGFGTRNFGIGLMELRALDLIDHYRKDLLSLLEKQGREFTSSNEMTFQIADAAWLFLGMLLYRANSNSRNTANNNGFVMLALILGSLPTKDAILEYLNSNKQQVEAPYSKKGKALLSREINNLAQSVYFLTGEELEELASLITECCYRPDYLDVLTASTGVSEEPTIKRAMPKAG